MLIDELGHWMYQLVLYVIDRVVTYVDNYELSRKWPIRIL